MKSPLKLATALAFAGLLPLAAFAADTKPVKKNAADYPLTTCVVSGDKLDHEGKPYEYTYKVAGKPDRVILLCCKDCVADFEKEPAKYLKKIDEAAAAKSKAKDGATHKH